jgi:tRNA 2-thiocytidine biosynthesis protein TtcA
MATPDSIAGFLLRGVNRAVRDFGLIADGDRIAIGVSGGKDSRTLLDLLVRGVDIPGTYSVVALHVDGSPAGLPDLKPQLEPWFQQLGVEYTIVPLSVPEEEALPMNCFRCAWDRRKTVFHAADTLKCNRIAFGHHADDAAVTTLMSMMTKGQVETLTPRLDYFGGRFSLIRPLIYLSEIEIKRFVRANGWEIPSEPTCQVGTTSRRVRIESFLSSFPRRAREQMRANLWRAARNHGEHSASGDEA